jgi:hypothetical protein
VNYLGFSPILAAAPATGPFAPALALVGSLAPIIPFPEIGAGRKEADAIVPYQNAIGERLGEINRAIPSANVSALQSFHSEVRQLGMDYYTFVLDPRFTADGDMRASLGGLNTLMQYIDGTGDYFLDADGIVKPGGIVLPGPLGAASGGTLGTIEAQLLQLGAALYATQPPQLSQSYGVPRLDVPSPGHPYLPESGWIPPTAPLSQIKTAGVVPVGTSENLLPAIILGAALLMLWRR